MLVLKRIYCIKNLKKRTLTVQSRYYKSYKNKLTNILRKSEKMYYNQLLHDQRDNIKSTWQTLNALIKKSKQSSTYPESFDDNDKCVSDKNVAVNKFNQYFVNVGVDLANKKFLCRSKISHFMIIWARLTKTV